MIKLSWNYGSETQQEAHTDLSEAIDRKARLELVGFAVTLSVNDKAVEWRTR